jgi:GT2 family glycosyltransferase
VLQTKLLRFGVMSKQPDVSILIVSYNTKAMTLACLDSVLAETRDIAFEIIVVDNASTDGSADALVAYAAQHPQVTAIALTDNAGFAGGNNIAAGYANGRQLLLLNPDTLVIEGAINRLVAVATEHPKAGIWGGKTILADGRVDGSCAWRHMTLWGVFCRTTGMAELLPNSPFWNAEAYGGWHRDTARPVDLIAGCFLLIDRSLWDQLDGFDPQFFMYGEEADLALRATAQGARPYYTPDAVIIHYGGASEATRVGKVEKLLKGKAMLAIWPLTRWLAHALADRWRPGRGHAEQAAAWQTLWLGRRRWLPGYPEPKREIEQHEHDSAAAQQTVALTT